MNIPTKIMLLIISGISVLSHAMQREGKVVKPNRFLYSRYNSDSIGVFQCNDAKEQDRYAIHRGSPHILAVFDDHGSERDGKAAANHAANTIIPKLLDIKKDRPIRPHDFGTLFERIDQEFCLPYLHAKKNARSMVGFDSGSTASVAIIQPGYGEDIIITANAGDSPIVLINSNDNHKFLYQKHQLIAEERTRLEQAGWNVTKLPVGAPTRGFGDLDLRPGTYPHALNQNANKADFISPIPHVPDPTLITQDDDFLIVSTDGAVPDYMPWDRLTALCALYKQENFRAKLARFFGFGKTRAQQLADKIGQEIVKIYRPAKAFKRTIDALMCHTSNYCQRILPEDLDRQTKIEKADIFARVLGDRLKEASKLELTDAELQSFIDDVYNNQSLKLPAEKKEEVREALKEILAQSTTLQNDIAKRAKDDATVIVKDLKPYFKASIIRACQLGLIATALGLLVVKR